MWIWFISGWLHLAIGFAIGWLVFKRPEMVSRAFDKVVAWFNEH